MKSFFLDNYRDDFQSWRLCQKKVDNNGWRDAALTRTITLCRKILWRCLLGRALWRNLASANYLKAPSRRTVFFNFFHEPELGVVLVRTRSTMTKPCFLVICLSSVMKWMTVGFSDQLLKVTFDESSLKPKIAKHKDKFNFYYFLIMWKVLPWNL